MGATVTDVVSCGDLIEVVTIISRLQDFLPEYGKTRTDERFAEHWKAIEELEQLLDSRRELMREEAMRIVESAKRNWTPAQIKKACGYPV